MQAQLELFVQSIPTCCRRRQTSSPLLQEQTERLSQMTKTLLEMSNLQQVERNESIQLAPHGGGNFHRPYAAGGEIRHHSGACR